MAETAFGSSKAFASFNQYQKQQRKSRPKVKHIKWRARASYEPYRDNGSLPYTTAGKNMEAERTALFLCLSLLTDDSNYHTSLDVQVPLLEVAAKSRTS